jgi:hypothetical protein
VAASRLLSTGSDLNRNFVVMRRTYGADGARTRGLQRATLALSQLSYGPRPPNCSLELEVLGPIDSELLVVACWGKPELDLPAVREGSERHEVAAVELKAIRRERVDLI